MPLESNIYGLWVAKQSAKGSSVTMTSGATKMPRWVGGDVQTNRADGNENFSDNTLFGGVVDFVNTLVGNGAPVLEGQAGIIAYMNWLAAGQETVTGGANEVQTVAITGAPTGGTFTLAYTINSGPNQGTWTTAAIAFNATAAAVASAVNLLAPFANSGGTVTGSGGPLPGSNVVLTYGGAFKAKPVPLLVAVGSLTGGTTPAVAVTRTTVGAPFSHVATPNDAGGFYSTWSKSVGKSAIHRAQYNDCRITSLRWEGSSASKVVKVTPTFLSLDPGFVPSGDGNATDDGNDPLIYTEGAGSFTIDGQVFTGHSAFAATAQWGIQEWYGDAVLPFDVVNQRATLTLDGITIIIDSAGLARYNNYIYGKTNPNGGERPVTRIPGNGSYSCKFQKKHPWTGLNAESFLFEVPGVKWSPDLNIPASPDGGAVEFAMAAEYRKVAGQPAWRATVENADAAYTA